MCTIPLDLERRFEQRWAAKFSGVLQEHRKPLRKLGHQLGPFGLGPSSGGGGAHVSQRTDCKPEFGDMVPERCFRDDKEVMLAGAKINLLDLDPDFLGEFSPQLDCAWERP